MTQRTAHPMFKSTISPVAVLSLFMLLLTGCDTMPHRDPSFAASYPAPLATTPQQQASSGSIYQAGRDVVLFQDSKARRVGDTLTIVLTESTNASKNSSNSINKAQNTTIANPTIFGASPSFALPGFLPLAAVAGGNNLGSSLSSSGAFAGGTKTAQTNSLTGDITVTIADVLPNGNLVVRGEKRINLNAGNEYVKVSGIVRPVDIQTDNSVLSNRVADATIVYNAEGAEADSSKMGWLARFFNSPWMPY